MQKRYLHNVRCKIEWYRLLPKWSIAQECLISDRPDSCPGQHCSRISTFLGQKIPIPRPLRWGFRVRRTWLLGRSCRAHVSRSRASTAPIEALIAQNSLFRYPNRPGSSPNDQLSGNGAVSKRRTRNLLYLLPQPRTQDNLTMSS